jgi:hypothetical protein
VLCLHNVIPPRSISFPEPAILGKEREALGSSVSSRGSQARGTRLHRGELWLENQGRVSRSIKSIQQSTLLLTLIFGFLSYRIHFTTSNLNDENLNKLTPDKIPDVVSQASFIFILTLKCTTKNSLSRTVFELVCSGFYRPPLY